MPWLGMGEFISVSAFQTDQTDRVLDAASRFFSASDCLAVQPEGIDVDHANDVLVFAAAQGWTVVAWPSYFADAPAAVAISAELDLLASTVSIHDGDYWRHLLIRSGQVLDRFASMPDYFTDDPEEIAANAATWAGNATVVADAFHRHDTDVARYFVHDITDADDGGDEEEEEPDPGLGGAFDDDEFDRAEPWVFVDFWRRIGITYPADVTAFAGRLRLAPGWSGRLPAGEEEL